MQPLNERLLQQGTMRERELGEGEGGVVVWASPALYASPAEIWRRHCIVHLGYLGAVTFMPDGKQQQISYDASRFG